MKRSAILCFAVLALHCSGHTPPSQKTPSRAEALARLASARAHWESRTDEMAGYDVQLQLRCQCAVTGDYVVEVRDGKATVEFDPADEFALRPHHRSYISGLDVPGLFKLVEDAISSDCDFYSVIYDLNYGYPTAIQTDCSTDTVDDEFLAFAEITTYPRAFDEAS